MDQEMEVLYNHPGSVKVLGYFRAHGGTRAPSTFGMSLSMGRIGVGWGGAQQAPRPPGLAPMNKPPLNACCHVVVFLLLLQRRAPELHK